jgi:putrescine transport system ATP-binding protein
LREETRRELIAIQQRVGTTFLVVTHDQEEALGMASRVAVMNAGRLMQIGTPADIYEHPDSRFVAGFVGEVNFFEGEVVATLGCPALHVRGIDAPLPLPEAAHLPAGSAIALALRPEKVLLSHDRPAGIVLMATVVAADYQGPVSILRLTTGAGLALKAHLPSSLAAGFARGAVAWVSWAPEDAVLVSQ